MQVATTHTVVLHGAVGHLVDVQADISPGHVGTVLVGRPDAGLQEARDRCKAAVVNTGLSWPSTRRTTILLSPADLPKRGTHFDLSMAVAVLAATGVVPVDSGVGSLFVGELTLTGGLRPVTGVLPMVLAAVQHGIGRVFVPEPQAREAAMVPGIVVMGMRSLAQVVAELQGDVVPEAPPVAESSSRRLLTWRGEHRLEEVDLADLVGLEDIRYAVEVAAAGGHHLLLSGPKGSGKTSVAERIPGILPDLTREEAVELAAVQSLAGCLDVDEPWPTRPPFSAPHHDASKASIVGGGSAQVRPGELSRAHTGVLFLDEFPLFRADVIDALRQPLESGEITIARAEESAVLPARTLVVLAANPCPCGNFHPSGTHDTCTCTVREKRAYRDKVRGPVSDRIDITRHLVPPAAGCADPFASRESTAAVRARIETARARQTDRFEGRSWRLNGHAPGPALKREWPLTGPAASRIDELLWQGKLSQRGAVRVQRMAWTVADLAGVSQPGVPEVDVALRLRLGEPLTSATLRRRAG